MDIFRTNYTRFFTLYYFVTACQPQWDLNTYLFDRYTDIFPKVRKILSDIAIIKSSVLVKGIYKSMINIRVNLRVNQDIT